MQREKQIRELAELLSYNYDMPLTFSMGLAEFLLDEGYVRTDELVKEIVADLKSLKDDFIQTDKLPKACAVRCAMIKLTEKYLGEQNEIV
jgi:hypothetical protein